MVVTIVLAVYVVGWAQVRLQDAIKRHDSATDGKTEQVQQVVQVPVNTPAS
jgi:hypothetical protein